MKKTRSKWLKAVSLITAGVLMAGICTSCGKKSGKDENGKTVITVGGWPSKEGQEKDDIEARKARFEEANPDISIKPDPWSFDLKTFYLKTRLTDFHSRM